MFSLVPGVPLCDSSLILFDINNDGCTKGNEQKI